VTLEYHQIFVCEFGIEVVVACLPMLLQNIFAKKVHAEFQFCCKNIIAKASYKTLLGEFSSEL
jgi:hypothetical protein